MAKRTTDQLGIYIELLHFQRKIKIGDSRSEMAMSMIKKLMGFLLVFVL